MRRMYLCTPYLLASLAEDLLKQHPDSIAARALATKLSVVATTALPKPYEGGYDQHGPIYLALSDGEAMVAASVQPGYLSPCFNRLPTYLQKSGESA